MSQKYYQQKQQILGGFSLQSESNTVTTSSAWEITVNANTSITRIYTADSGVYLKIDDTASSSSWDYYLPASMVVDLYNVTDASTYSIIADDSDALVKVAQY